MTTTVHHPSCPQRHDDELACLCGPEARAEDALILRGRTPDTMLLDVLAHAAMARTKAWGPGPIARRMRARARG